MGICVDKWGCQGYWIAGCSVTIFQVTADQQHIALWKCAAQSSYQQFTINTRDGHC